MLLNLNTEYSTLTNQVNGGFLCYEALILILLYNLKDKLEFSIHSLFIPLLSISTLPNIYFQIPGKPILVIHCWLPSVCLIHSFIHSSRKYLLHINYARGVFPFSGKTAVNNNTETQGLVEFTFWTYLLFQKQEFIPLVPLFNSCI